MPRRDSVSRRGARPSQARQSNASRRNPRLRLACLRCQRRKIRCDGELPACEHCRNAGVDCADGESARLKNLPRAYIVSLKERIQWLESIVRDRCPEVDLTHGPALADIPDPYDHADESMQDVDAGLTTPVTTAGLGTSPLEDAHHNTTLHIAPNTTETRLRPILGGGNALSHEIGLVSLGTNQDPRYIGPSSGYFLARVMLTKPSVDQDEPTTHSRERSFPCELVEAVQGPLPLPARHLAEQLSKAYFDVIHFQYPILHKPTFIKMLDQAYEQNSLPKDPVISFQVNMVLAIGATVMSGRLQARLPGESLCLSALQHFDKLNIENSLQGLQCLILLLIFTIHSPYVRLNVWYLNYQCIAALLDLGLQRDINTGSGVTLLEQEMRTRIFWVVFMLDRTIATMMGRPIGLRDEGCELRLPQVLDEATFSMIDPNLTDSMSRGSISPISYSVHLFGLAKLNSEIKYVANSITRDTPQYAYPAIIDILDWQRGVKDKLDQWAADIPKGDTSCNHMILVSRLRYHSLRMLLLRPSPAIPKPTPEALKDCHESAKESIHIFDELYRKNLLVHSWMTFHSLVLSTLTMLYCLKAAPDLARSIRVDTIMADLSVGLSILSATGEHWSGAKRCRDILDDLGRSTIRWVMDLRNTRIMDTQPNNENQTIDDATIPSLEHAGPSLSVQQDDQSHMMGTEGGVDASLNPFDDFLAGGESLTEYFEPSEFVNMDMIMRDLFQDFIPINTQLT